VEGARIDDITQRAGVSRGTFYFHFPSKDDVLADLMTQSQLKVVAKLAELPDTTEILEVLETVATTIADQWRDEPQLLAEIGMVALRQTAQNLPDLGEVHPVRGALIPWLEAAAHRGEIGALMPPQLLAEFFLVNVFGAALAWVGNPVVPLDQLLRNVVLFFLKATRS
jgi:AcrR family transcriptional regulator